MWIFERIFACIKRFGFALLFLLLVGCVGKQQEPLGILESNAQAGADFSYVGEAVPSSISSASSSEFSLDDYDDDFADSAQAIFDPLEPWNRFWFGVNEVLLLKVIKPVSKGYTTVVPQTMRNGLANFWNNLRMPVRFVNALLQGEFAQSGVELGRFFINMVTSLGFANVADKERPLYPHHPETLNFNYTLGKWHIPAGPYVIWPLFGPNTVRGTVGVIGDSFMQPQRYFLHGAESFGSSAFFTFNSIDSTISAYETLLKISLDPYISLRSGFFTRMVQQQ